MVRVPNNKTPKDPRSTQRKRAQAILIKVGREYECVGFGAPCGRTEKLQVNHINKNIMDNDPANLEYLCPSCHRKKDNLTSKGVSVIENEFGYVLGLPTTKKEK